MTTPDPRGSTAPEPPPLEELRIALVLNGGVSLAIWMGGAVNEIDRLTRGQGHYAVLARWAATSARVDVIAGTSAGGINGAALAISQANMSSQGMGVLRDVWADNGDLARLMRQPFQGQPTSLLKGDEFFLPRLRDAMEALAEPFVPWPVDERPIDLSITGTLLTGIPGVVVDSLGQRVGQTRHDALFRFQRGPTHRKGAGEDDFAGTALPGTLAALALAARTTASFPVAFEPSYIPARPGAIPASDDSARPAHPDMSAHLGGAWEQSQGELKSRFAIDGGVLANTPTRAAMEAIERMPARGLVRRVMLLVHPHAPAPGTDSEQSADQMPTVTEVSSGILGVQAAQGSRNHVDAIEAHNRLAAAQRDVRASVVGGGRGAEPIVDPVQDAAALYRWYREVRLNRNARDLAELWLSARAPIGPTPPREQILAQVGDALTRVASSDWLPLNLTDGSGPPSAQELGERAPALGLVGALGIAHAATDYLRRVNWALALGVASGTSAQDIAEIRSTVSEAKSALLDLYAQVRGRIESWVPTTATVAPGSLEKWVVEAHTELLGVGDQMSALLAQIAQAVARARVLVAEPGADSPMPNGEALTLARFATQLGLAGPSGPADQVDATHAVLGRLNAIHIVTNVVSDEMASGASLPIELVQLTFQVKHPFAPNLTGEGKVAGDTVHRFSAFLKRYWRINDWIWGRLDASRLLCSVVLDPPRVRRAVQGMVDQAMSDGASDTTTAVQDVVNGLYMTLFGSLEPEVTHLPTRAALAREVGELLAEGSADGTAEGKRVDVLRDVFAMALALEVTAPELPVLVSAVEQDLAEKTNPGAIGAVVVQRNAALLRSAPSATSEDQRRALGVFASSGIGAEAVADEATSDKLIATATNAAAVALTVADSHSSGMTFARPITRAIRGAALLPFWTIRGLTGGGAAAQGLSILTLAAGGALLALGLLGVGPSWGIAVGGGALLAGFAVGAMRSGTLLHGVVLLVPGLVLLVVGAQSVSQGSSTDSVDVGALAGLVLLLGGLIVLGSVSQPVPSPRKWMGNRGLGGVVGMVGIALALGLALLPATRDAMAELASGIIDSAITLIELIGDMLPFGGVVLWTLVIGLPVVGYLVVGANHADRVGRAWRRVVRDQNAEAGWSQRPVEHPTGTTAGWSVVYGGVLLAVCGVVLAWYGFRWPSGDGGGDDVARALLLTCAVMAVLLILPVPWAMHRRTRRQVIRRAAAAWRAAAIGGLPGAAGQSARIDSLFAAGLNFAELVRIRTDARPGGAEDPPWSTLELTASGRDAWAQHFTDEVS